MIPIDQTRLSSPDGSTKGNCFLACIASLFEIPLDEVPELEDVAIEQHSSWPIVLEKWCLSVGWKFLGCVYKPSDTTDQEFLQDCQRYSHTGYLIVGGESPRDYVSAGHSVIYCGNIMTHDPHPSRDGVLNIREIYVFLPINHPMEDIYGN